MLFVLSIAVCTTCFLLNVMAITPGKFFGIVIIHYKTNQKFLALIC